MTNDEIAAIKRDYDRDGFAILPNYVQGEALAELRHRATELATALFAEQERATAKRAKTTHGLRNILKNLQHHDPWFERQLAAGKHLPLIEALVEDQLVPATAAWFTKRAGSAEAVAPHRDSIGRAPGSQNGATIWIALDAADHENGCLHYARGSHRLDIDPRIPYGELEADDESAVAVVVQPGDAVVHSALTVHWSHGNPTARSRRAVSYFYWGASGQQVAEARTSQREKPCQLMSQTSSR